MSRVRQFLLVLLMVLAAGCTETTETTVPAREPLIVYRICCGFGSSNGQKTPIFALYSDGLVIFQTAPGRFLSAQLDETERQALYAEFATEEFLRLDRHYEGFLVFDAATYILDVWYNGRRKRVSVYYMPDADERPGHVPAAFLHAHDIIEKFAPAAAPYTPEWIELQVWPRGKPTEPALQWPDSWPPLTTAEGPDQDSARWLFLPGADSADLQRFLNSRKPGQLVESEGRLWAIARSPRVVFPGEELWLR